MKRVSIITVSLVMALALTLVASANVMAGQIGSKEVLTGTIHCLDKSGTSSTKADVCPSGRIGHIIITGDGRAVMREAGRRLSKWSETSLIPRGTR